MQDNEVYVLLRVPSVTDRETQILAMIIDLLEHAPSGPPQRLDGAFDKLIADRNAGIDYQQRKRISKYLYERFGRGRL